MNDLLTFDFETQSVRVVQLDGELWFVAADVAAILDYRDAPNLVRNVDEDEAATHIVRSSGQRREMSIISESGLFAAILKSRKPEARAFRRWVTGTVLPQLRATGRFQLVQGEPAPPLAIDLDPARLAAGVSVVREARRLFGPRAARALWPQLGLPPCTLDAEDERDCDPMADPLRLWLADRHECTIQQAGEGIGLAALDWSTRQRLGRLLRLMGWDASVRRLGPGRTAKVFTRTSAAAAMEATHDQL